MGGVAFLLGGYLIADDWCRQDKADARRLQDGEPFVGSRALAAEAVKHDRIEFGVYRDLLRAALAEQDAQARSVAGFRSIRDVLAIWRRFRRRSAGRAEKDGTAFLVTTTTTKAGVDAADAVEKELQDIGMSGGSFGRP